MTPEQKKAKLNDLYDKLRTTSNEFDRIEDRVIELFSDEKRKDKFIYCIENAMFHMAFARDQINAELSALSVAKDE